MLEYLVERPRSQKMAMVRILSRGRRAITTVVGTCKCQGLVWGQEGGQQ